MRIANLIFGDPLKTENLASERLTKVKALAVFSSDVISSVAYATEEILLALGVVLAYSFSVSVTGVIIGLLAVISVSYWQTLEAYPNGGGAFAVAFENLGEFFGLIASSALLVDYTLTSAVGLSAGTSAIISAIPVLAPYRVSICLIALLIIVVMNLRGAQESATVFSIPTYGFIGLMLIMVVGGIFIPASPEVSETVAKGMNKVTDGMLFIVLLRAFAAGCCALTGMETIACGVTAFKEPQYKNARIALVSMGVILSVLFMGISFLADKYSIIPNSSETVVSQIARHVFGTGFWYYMSQLATTCILFLAVNTSFASFPRLASILAKQKYIPTRFANLGDRLAFSNGIIMLGFIAMLLIITFKGDSHALIPLYAIGVYLSYTLSQGGMVVHWLKKRGVNWHIKAAINALGALATLVTFVIILESKFLHGAWIVTILVPLLFYGFRTVNRRYLSANNELDIKRGGLGDLLKPLKATKPKVVVPISRVHKGTLAALRFAASLSDDAVAVIVNVSSKETERLKLAWRSLNFNIPLVILDSPYRSVVNPFLDFLFEQDDREPERGKAIVVMPSFVTGKFWHNILHNQTATIFKTALLYRRQKSEQTRVIVEIPYQMKIS
ncbi:MAG: APC family permease [Alphaproteobacteria bacterium]|nr:APC family permease [Alphaproteobacteria bacterium]